MTKIVKKCFFAQVMLLMAGVGFVACGDPFSRAGASEDPNQFTASIEGVIEKGPFVKGTSVTLYELNPETFAQTGKVFTGNVKKDDGSFALEKIELESPYALLEADGYYWSELSGRKSDNSLKLKAIAHVEESSNININVGTHLTSSRVLALVDSGMDFDKAKEQAESELMKAFFGEESKTDLEKASIFDNEKLLALSLIVLMSGSEADVTEALANISENFADEAVLTNLADKSAMQYGSYGKAREFMQEKFPDVQIGLFENYIVSFWERIYGIGVCGKSKVGTLDTIKAERSAVNGYIVACRDVDDAYLWFMATDLEVSINGLADFKVGQIVKSVAEPTKAYVYGKDGWRIATDMDISVENQEPVDDGRLVKSVEDSTKAYVCDGDEWRAATADELKLGESCTASRIGTIVKESQEEYVCKKSESSVLWQKATIRDFPKETYFNGDIEYGSVTDKRDGHVYKTVEIGGKTWMAENLAYVVKGVKCPDSLTVGCGYSWHTAFSLDQKDTVLEDNHGICMDGWHIPDSTEWRALIDAYDLENLLSETGWSSGKNGSGFSVVPFAYASGAGFVYAYNRMGYADFVVANYTVGRSRLSPDPEFGMRLAYGYAASFDKSKVEITTRSATAIRCVKDSE